MGCGAGWEARAKGVADGGMRRRAGCVSGAESGRTRGAEGSGRGKNRSEAAKRRRGEAVDGQKTRGAFDRCKQSSE